jgi:hypothetical protein
MKNFSLKKVQDLKPSEQLKAQAYVSKYFIPLSNGMHAFYNDGKYEIIDHNTILKTYFDRMPKTLKDYYFKQNIDIRTINPVRSNSTRTINLDRTNTTSTNITRTINFSSAKK